MDQDPGPMDLASVDHALEAEDLPKCVPPEEHIVRRHLAEESEVEAVGTIRRPLRQPGEVLGPLGMDVSADFSVFEYLFDRPHYRFIP